MEKLLWKKRVNKYIVLDDLQVNLPETCETEIITQDELIVFWNQTLSGKQCQNMKENSFPEILTKTTTKDISTEVVKQQYEHILLYILSGLYLEADIEWLIYLLLFNHCLQHNLSN